MHRIRMATTDDLERMTALEQQIFPTDAWSAAMLRQEVESAGTVYLAAESEQGDLVGYAGLLAPAGAQEADVQTLALTPGARGRGLGRALLQRLIAVATERGVREVFLEVRADNAVAQRLYESAGFEAVGVRPRYYQPDDVDAVVMRLALAAPVPAGEAQR